MGITHPLDILIVLKLVANRSTGKRWTYAQLGNEFGTSASQAFRSIQRAEEARLLNAPTVPPPPGLKVDNDSQLMFWPNKTNVKEFLIYGLKYVFPVKRGGPTRGVLTAEAAPPLALHFSAEFPLPPVWPYPQGTARGIEFSPLHKSAPAAALRDPKLYELLALVDALREGRSREREISIRELAQRIDQ